MNYISLFNLMDGPKYNDEVTGENWGETYKMLREFK